MLTDSNTRTFQKLFKNKLSEMLKPDELGSFILVLANSMQDTQLHESLAAKLASTFKELNNNNNLQGSEDDLVVFRAIQQMELSQFTAWKTRQIKPWSIAYNPLRALRPARSSNEVFMTLEQPFNEDGFHFDKAFLHPEIISEEAFENTNLRIMYHKFSFIPYHLLIVVDAAEHRPQFLEYETHRMAWNLVNHIENNIKGFGLAFNSIGAGASINHLHLHGFISDSSLAVEDKRWQHNDGSKPYPLPVKQFTILDQSWQYIQQLHQQNQPYNLLYRAGSCFVIKRKPQGAINLPEWLTSIGWYEACGGFNFTDESYYQTLTTDNIQQALSLGNL